MIIEVQMGVSTSTETQNFTLEDLGVTKLEWDSLNEEGKYSVLEDAILNLSNQPYWMIDDFKEN